MTAMMQSLQQPSRMICGVCARVAVRAELPVALIRALAVGLLLMHGVLTLILYLGAAVWLREGTRGARRDASGWRGGCSAGGAGDREGLTDRFGRLERRLSRMEAASLDREAGLRRAFRDLER